jgi:uncharacterized protein
MALSVRAGLPRRVRAAVRPRVDIVATPPDVHVDSDLPIRLRDGVVLRANVFRPQLAGTFPVIVSAHPYNKDLIRRAAGRGAR